MIEPSALTSTCPLFEELPVTEQTSFSTADLMRVEFRGEYSEPVGGVTLPLQRAQKFRVIDGDLYLVAPDTLPPNSQPLTDDAAILKVGASG